MLSSLVRSQQSSDKAEHFQHRFMGFHQALVELHNPPQTEQINLGTLRITMSDSWITHLDLGADLLLTCLKHFQVNAAQQPFKGKKFNLWVFYY